MHILYKIRGKGVTEFKSNEVVNYACTRSTFAYTELMETDAM